MVLGDVIKRWQLLKGNPNAIFLTGTDEHGIKIQQAAQAAGMDTQAFCDMNCKTFMDLARAAKIGNDHFMRTTDEAHKDAVRYFWESLQHRGYIYTKKHEGWYSVSDEAFYPQSQVEPSLDPATGRKRMVYILNSFSMSLANVCRSPPRPAKKSSGRQRPTITFVYPRSKTDFSSFTSKTPNSFYQRII
jgi:hypothetical protein